MKKGLFNRGKDEEVKNNEPLSGEATAEARAKGDAAAAAVAAAVVEEYADPYPVDGENGGEDSISNSEGTPPDGVSPEGTFVDIGAADDYRAMRIGQAKGFEHVWKQNNLITNTEKDGWLKLV